jgi:hypothetical protein
MILSIMPFKTLSIKTYSIMVPVIISFIIITPNIKTFRIMILSASTHKHNGLNCGTLRNIIFNVNLSVIILLMKRLFKQTYLAS